MDNKPLTELQVRNQKWMLLQEMIDAAHEANARRYKSAAHRLADVLPNDATVSYYLYYLLRQTITQRLAGAPATREAVTNLAKSVVPCVQRMTRAREKDISKVMLFSMNLLDEKRPLGSAAISVFGSVTLGCLLDDVRNELAALHPGLVAWYRETFG